MIYLRRVAADDSIKIEVCEKIDRVSLLISQGYQMITRATYIEEWRKRDLARGHGDDGLCERAVGDTRHKIVGALPGKVYPPFETGL